MTLRVTSFASGSSGNALLIQADNAALLLDCGLPQRVIERHLGRAGLRPADLSAILLTHEHGDHALSAGPLARRHGIPIVTNAETAAALGPALGGAELVDLVVGGTLALGPFGVRSFAVPHDAAAPVGYTIEAGGWCVGVAIDLGSWDDGVLDGLRAADLVVLESNHDRERLRLAPYDWAVKQRIYSRLGHLDNMDAGALLARLGADGRRRTAWLAHLSERANSPQIATKIVSSVLAVAQIACFDIQALPRRAALTWESDRHVGQMELFL
ncbi:MAG TPA: MBL fold metallo-hydrolase [Roseiflexaceae bacterium]|nr:MBL fold metallo-hydrolase [Roseiflexaceae bacterium]